MAKQEIEKRSLPAIELRADDSYGKMNISGYASEFGVEYPVLWWDEQFSKGAFEKTIKEADIRMLWNHKDEIVLGRNRAGTLKINEDERGLHFENTPPDWASGYHETIKRGDVDQMSIRFSVIKETWDKEYTKRNIQEVHLFEISPCTFAASPTTKASVRSLFSENGVDENIINGFLFRAKMGAKFNTDELKNIKDMIEKLSAIIPADLEPEKVDSHSEDRNHSDKEPDAVIIEPVISRHSIEAEIDILNTFIQTFKRN